MDNRQIADRLESFASLLELAEANPYTARAYRRAGELIRATPVPVAELVRSGRARELRGIGSGIEARLRELVETGEIHPLRPGTLYALDSHERHLLRARTEMRMICVFNPPLTGREVHDSEGAYPLIGDEVPGT